MAIRGRKNFKNDWRTVETYHTKGFEYRVSINRAKSPKYFKKIESWKKGSKVSYVEYYTTMSSRKPAKRFKLRSRTY